MRGWLSGIIFACHAKGRGSIPRPRIIFVNLTFVVSLDYYIIFVDILVLKKWTPGF